MDWGKGSMSDDNAGNSAEVEQHGNEQYADPDKLVGGVINVDESADLPVHRPRHTDYDPRAAKRAERQVATCFGLSALFTVLFVVSFVVFPVDTVFPVPFFGEWSASNCTLGLTFGLAVFFIGAGLMQWAKKLMNDHEVAQKRHDFRSPEANRRSAIEQYEAGVEDSGFVKHRMARRSLLMAMSLFPIPLIVILRDLGPLPGNALFVTSWGKGVRVVMDITGAPIRPQDIPVGGIVSAMPENLPEIQHETGTQNARAKDVVLLVRMNPDEILAQQGGTDEEPWDYHGILCFSKICTHVGCPIALYEQRTHHLLCPCHQSTFDLADRANVVFGPAARELPQLPITLDDEGYIVARAPFNQPVGPSFWERA